MSKKKYYPNNYDAFREAPHEWFGSIPFDELMDWKIGGWEIPSSVACMIRETTKTGKVKEHIYSRKRWANKKIKELLVKGHEFTIAADNELAHVPSQYLE